MLETDDCKLFLSMKFFWSAAIFVVNGKKIKFRIYVLFSSQLIATVDYVLSHSNNNQERKLIGQLTTTLRNMIHRR